MKETLKVSSYTYSIESLSDDDFYTQFCEVNCGAENIDAMCKFSDGFIDYARQIMYIRESLHSDVLSVCTLNLIIELLANSSGLDSLSGVPLNSVTQVVMAILSPHLLSVLRDNEDVLRRLGVIGQRRVP